METDPVKLFSLRTAEHVARTSRDNFKSEVAP
jgi:hypothetical protein